MSKAFKCDRCKICFDPLDICDNDEFITIPEYFSQTKTDYEHQRVSARFTDKHLCPACFEEFMEFMCGKVFKKEKKDEDSEMVEIPDGIPTNIHSIPASLVDMYVDKLVERRLAGFTNSSNNAPERPECSEENSKH